MKKAKEQAEETISKKSQTEESKPKEKNTVAKEKAKDKTKKVAKKDKSEKKVKAAKKSGDKSHLVLHQYKPNTAKGQIAKLAAQNGSVTEKEAKKVAGKKDVGTIFNRIRRRGKKDKSWNFFPSTKVEGKWVMKVTDKARMSGAWTKAA